MPKLDFLLRSFFLIGLLTSCSRASVPTPTISHPPSTASPPTQAQPAPLANGSPFKTGLSYSDASGDMPISFLDVVSFQASVDDASETLKIVLRMRDIPPDAPRGQVTNLVE